MDYKQMTAPCGLDCFNCPMYLANENEEMRTAISKNTAYLPTITSKNMSAALRAKHLKRKRYSSQGAGTSDTTVAINEGDIV